MSYPHVLILSTPFAVYGDQTDADLYLMASTSADDWNAIAVGADNAVKAKALVSGVRWLSSVTWLGTKTDPAQELDFPRTGLAYHDGTPVDPSTIPQQVARANFELGALLVSNPTAREELWNTKPKSLTAGSVNISFFRPIGGGAGDVQVTTPFPDNVMSLIGMWVSSSASVTGPIVSDVCKESQLERPHDFIHGI